MSDQKQDPVLIDVPMPIRTPRLILRPPQAGDGAAMHEAKAETWEGIHKWMPWTKDGLGTAEESEAVARKAQAKFILREDLMLIGHEAKSGRAVIYTGLHRFDWQHRSFEIGYWVRQSAQGKGYATESTNALIRYAFGALNARRVQIDFADGNEASHAVIKKLGLCYEGAAKLGIELPDGRYVDRHHYSRTDMHGLPDLDVRWGMP